ncbi:MAG: hypothetical protein H6Q79_1199 [Deltaproteobacteria bacterium]|nr:hypothetical protein [Deltaproteobacteria bacterium]
MPPPSPPPLPQPPRIEVAQLQMSANREFVGARFRMIGADRLDPDASEIYLVDEASGEKFTVVRLQRIGRLAEFRVPGEENVHFILFRNRQGKLKIGSRVTIVVGPARQEHQLVQP